MSIIDLAAESTEEREARLQRRYREGVINSPPSQQKREREVRLHQMSVPQHERLATESSEEREARLHRLHA